MIISPRASFLRALLLIASLGGAVAAAGQASDGAPQPPAAAAVADETPAQKLGAFEIVSVARARALVADKRVHPIDARPVAKYLAGHIPGAIHLDDEVLRGPSGALPVQFHRTDELAAIFARAGVSVGTPVLAYGDGEDPLSAAIMAYALLKTGHPRVLLLDGGFEAWRGVAEVSQEHGVLEVSDWRGSPPAEPVAASLDEVRRVVDTDEGVLVDARPAKVYRGEGKGWMRNGHIPGAVNIDWKSLMRADNEALFKPRKEIEAILRAAGLDPSYPTIVYCGTGREATLLYLYLRCVLEWQRVTLYEGSWTEWSSDPSLPVAIGDEPFIPVYADGDVLVSGQPSEALLRELADQGVTLVISCRTPREMAALSFNQSALAKSLGIATIDIPLGGSEGFEPKDVEAFKSALVAHKERDQGGKVLLHCASGGRAAELWVAHLVVNEGLTPEAAEARARAAGIRGPSGLDRLLGRDRPAQPKP